MALGERYTCLARICDMPDTLLVPHHYSPVFLMRKLSFSEVTETNFSRSSNLQVRMLRLSLSNLKAQAIVDVTLPFYEEICLTLYKCLFVSFLVILDVGDNVSFRRLKFQGL